MMLTIINNHIADCVAILNDHGFKVQIDKVKVTKRMTRSLGIMQLRTKNGIQEYTLKINGNAFTEDSKELRGTVFHEVCHAADKLNFGNMEHGSTWKKLMVTVGMEPEQYVTKEKVESIGYTFIPKVRGSQLRVKCDGCEKTYKLTKKQMVRLLNLRCPCGGGLSKIEAE